MQQQRRRFKQSENLKDQLASFAKEAREKATRMPPCAEKDDLLRRARQADTAFHLDEWINSPGLRPPE